MKTSKMYIVCKTSINGQPIDIGHSMLSVGHSVGRAFNAWSGEAQQYYENLLDTVPTIDIEQDHLIQLFEIWRYASFRKVICQATEQQFEIVKEKLKQHKIPFLVCGEQYFGPDAEIALVVFPLQQCNVPKCLQFLQKWGTKNKE